MFCVNLFILGMLMGDLRPSDKEYGGDEIVTPEPVTESPPAKFMQKSVQDTPTNSAPTADAKEAEAIAQQFSIKGITRNADKSSLTLQSAKKTYTIFLGQLVSVQTDDGLVSVRFTDLGADWVALDIKGTQVKRPIPVQ
jgi:hypothetical protein